MMTRVLCILALAATLGGCGRAGIFKSDQPMFDGQRFRTVVKTERKNRQVFAVTVHQVSKSVEGARAAADYKAKQHCIQYFGTSEIDWTVAPDADVQSLRIVDNTLTFRGSCHDEAA
ncbi:hypothetical protein WAF00_14560 [Mameliella alba]|uniref:hypothetical protein n=2 Tax=Mameliella alba TaxID=561184 RepID=UPI003012EFF9